MTHVDQKQPWTLSLRAKVKNLDLKINASKFLPACKLFRVSIQLKLHKCIFEIKSKPESSFSFKPKSLKPKFLKIFRIFHRGRAKNKGIVRNSCAYKNYFYGRRKNYLFLWSWVLLFAVLGCFVIMQLRNYCVWKCFCKVLSYAAPSRLLYQFSKYTGNHVIFEVFRRVISDLLLLSIQCAAPKDFDLRMAELSDF